MMNDRIKKALENTLLAMADDELILAHRNAEWTGHARILEEDIALANIAQGLEHCLYLGNMDSLRDWGHAKDYVRMQWLMLQQDKPEDFVIATGKQISVRDFVRMTAAHVGLELEFSGAGVEEIATVAAISGDNAPGVQVGDIIVRVSPRYFRPAEVETLLGDPTNAKTKLGWVPEISVEEMCAEMVANDLEQARQHALLKANGFNVSVTQE